MRVLCFGDSHTWGLVPVSGSRFDFSERWTGVLQGLLPSDAVVIEEGLAGRNTGFDDPLHVHANSWTYLEPCLLSHSPLDWLILQLGTNCFRDRLRLSASEIGYTLDRLIHKVQSLDYGIYAPPEIVVVSPPRVLDVARVRKQYACSDEQHSEVLRFYSAIAHRRGCVVLHASEISDPSEEDGIHFDGRGHELLGHAIYSCLLRHLEESP
jgi:lysophospholipase L1-like esterase